MDPEKDWKGRKERKDCARPVALARLAASSRSTVYFLRPSRIQVNVPCEYLASTLNAEPATSS
jgi:hypothetical protein